MSNGQEGYYQQAPGDQWGVSGIRVSELAQPFPPPLPVMQGFDSQGRLLTAQSVQPWEYLQEEIPQVQWQMRLEMLGAEGWELVHQVESYPRYWLCFFKRPKG